MGYPTIWAEGTLTSLGNANFYSNLLSKCIPNRTALLVESDDFDTTPENQVFERHMPGQYAYTLEVGAEAFAAPVHGLAGLIAYSAGGYALHVRAWRLRMAAQEFKITEQVSVSAGYTSHLWRPGNYGWSATVECVADSTTALVLPQTPTAGGAEPSYPTVTLSMASGVTLAGSAFIRQLGVTRQRGGECFATYELRGRSAITPAGASNPLGTSIINSVLWSEANYATPASGVGPWQLNTNATEGFEGDDCFWTAINIDCSPVEPVTMNFTLRGSGAVAAL